MGKIRARTDEELAARKQDIMDAAAEEIMTQEYDSITLATIAEKTSISRTSMYTYYDRKETVFVDLLILEYKKLEKRMQEVFYSPLTREEFCKAMSGLLWQQPILLKLLSLQLSVWDKRYDKELLKRFAGETRSYMMTLDEVLEIQFPESDRAARNVFKIQLSVYCNSLYSVEHLPVSQLEAMNELKFFDSIPSGQEICYEGLMLLSAGLE